jgi:type VI protein secretion system component Hcp
MSMTVVVYLDGIGGMSKSDFSTWATAGDFPSLSLSRRMSRTSNGKALTVNEAPEYYNIPVQLHLSDNMTGDLHDHFVNKKEAIKEVIISEVADRNDKNSKAITQVVLTDVIVQNLTLDTDASSGSYYASTVLDFQTIKTHYGNGSQKKDITWEKGVRQG